MPTIGAYGLDSVYEEVVKNGTQKFRVAHDFRDRLTFDHPDLYIIFGRLSLDDSQRIFYNLTGIDRPQIGLGRPGVVEKIGYLLIDSSDFGLQLRSRFLKSLAFLL